MNALVFYLKFIGVSLWLIFATVVSLPYCLLRWGDLNHNRRVGRLIAWGIQRIGGIRLEVQNMSYGDTPAIYIGNHQSALDVGTFAWLCPPWAVVIGKKEIIWIPFFGPIFWAAGNVMIDRKNRTKAVSGLQEVLDVVRERRANVFLFPEGTRNRAGDGKLLPFKKGAFHMAIEAQIPIRPIVSSPLGELLSSRKGERRFHGGTIQMRFLPPIPTQGMTIADVDRLKDQAQAAMAQALSELRTTVRR